MYLSIKKNREDGQKVIIIPQSGVIYFKTVIFYI